MNMNEWAKREIDIAIKRERGDGDPNEWDYDCACYESAYKAFCSLLEDGHSGFSIQLTKNIFNSMIRILQLNKPYDPRCGRHTVMHFDVCENCRQDVLDYILGKSATSSIEEV